MKLLTKAIRNQLPELYANEEKTAEETNVIVKFFNPTGAATWYATEFDGEDIFFGYVTGLGEDELGYFSLAELTAHKGPLGLGIERDMHYGFKHTLAAVMSGEATAR